MSISHRLRHDQSNFLPIPAAASRPETARFLAAPAQQAAKGLNASAPFYHGLLIF
ncbi:MAG: hypothetical protein VX346_27570 [Planctomycetota bacterium]|nr:hypothetical protein [Planctomycetota bacterium]